MWHASSMKIAILAPNSQGDRFLSQSSALVPDCLSATHPALVGVKSTTKTLERLYPGSSLIPYATHSGHQIGLLFGSATGDSLSSDPFYLLYFYGNGTRLHTCSYEFAYFRRLGLHVLIPEYPGYGISSGQAGEGPCYESAEAAYHYLTEMKQIPSTQIIIGGMSLGAAVAIDLASRKPAAGL